MNDLEKKKIKKKIKKKYKKQKNTTTDSIRFYHVMKSISTIIFQVKTP